MQVERNFEARSRDYCCRGKTVIIMRIVRKVKNVCAYNLRSCVIVPDQSCGVFSRV